MTRKAAGDGPARKPRADAATRAPRAPEPPIALVPKGLRKARPSRAPAESTATREARERALAIAAAGLEKKALDVEILDVAGRVDYADYLVLMTGRSDRHVASIVQGIEDELRKKGSRATSLEGMPAANWVLVDFSDVVVHVFQESARGLYDIEGLWMDARRVPVPYANDEPRA